MLLVRAPSGGTIDALAEVEPVQVIRNAIRGNQSTEMVTGYRGKPDPLDAFVRLL